MVDLCLSPDCVEIWDRGQHERGSREEAGWWILLLNGEVVIKDFHARGDSNFPLLKMASNSNSAYTACCSVWCAVGNEVASRSRRTTTTPSCLLLPKNHLEHSASKHDSDRRLTSQAVEHFKHWCRRFKGDCHCHSGRWRYHSYQRTLLWWNRSSLLLERLDTGVYECVRRLWVPKGRCNFHLLKNVPFYYKIRQNWANTFGA